MDENKLRKFNIVETIWVVIYSIILYFLTYIIMTDDVLNNIVFITYLPDYLIKYPVVGYLIVLNIFLIIKSLIKDNFKTNIISTIIILIITLISYYKYKVLKLPFVPNDALLIGNANQIAEFGLSIPSISIIIIVFIIIAMLALQKIIRNKFYKKQKASIKTDWYRIALFIVGAVSLYNICISPNRFKKLNLKNDLGNNYFWMGGNAVFFMHLGDFYYPAPEGYNLENINKMQQEETGGQSTVSKENPNVIFIMNESFSDPNKIKDVRYSVNPMQNIYTLKEQENCIYGQTSTAVIGGGTSLPEFEALTGMSSYYLEKQIFPYTSYIKSDINSIVRVYNSNEYTTVGFHPNTKTFYNRENVYKYLGFDKTIFLENMKNPEIKAGRVSDNEFANQIIKIYDETEGKKFIFGVTMQNHMPYDGNLYENYDVIVESNKLEEGIKQELQNYVQGIYDSDQMYIKLVNYLKTTNEPTILVMFGDHLPSISGFDLYKNSDFSAIDYYTTPYIVWANYNMESKELPEFMSPSCLAVNILKISNIELPWYLKKFEQLYINYPSINNNFVINKEAKIIRPETIKNYDIVKDCNVLQYDLLIKKKYIPIK